MKLFDKNFSNKKDSTFFQYTMSEIPEDQQIVLDEGEESFIKEGEAVEVQVDDNDVPMDEEDEEGKDQPGNEESGENVPDLSIQTIASHQSSSVYTVSSHYDQSTNTLKIITGGGDDKAFLHKLDNNNQLVSMQLPHNHTDSVSSVATNEKYVSPDLAKTPKYVAVGAYDGSIILYNPENGEKIKTLDGPTDVEFVSFHPKGGSVLLAGSISDATVWMYHLPSSKCLQVFVGHECNGEGGGVTGGCFTPDGKFALTIGMDGTLRHWAPRTGMCRHVFKLTVDDGDSDDMGPAGLTCLAVDGGADGQLAVAGAENGNAYVVHLQGKKVVGTLRHFDVAQANNAEDDEMMITSVESVGFASKLVNPNWVATGGSDGVLKIWDLTIEGQCRQSCSVPDSSTGGVTKIFWHPTQPIFFASYTDGAVRIWDARSGELLQTLTNGKFDNQINDISVEVFGTDQGPGNAIVITANDDGNCKVFNVDVNAAMKR